MLRIGLTAAVLLIGALALAGCDKCGEPIKFNTPSLPGVCYGAPAGK